MPLLKKPSGGKNDRGEDTIKSGGKYRKKEPLSPHVADFINSRSNVVRHPTAVKRSEHQSQLHSGPGGNKSTRSLSVPSLHATTETKAKFSPPLSPQKPRSKSVRVQPAKKTLSFKKIKKFFGSHSELDHGGGGASWADGHQTVGTYRQLNITRPRSIGGSSDCSITSMTQSDFSRCNSLRDSSRSRISVATEVMQGTRQASYDSNDYISVYPNHVPSGSTDSSLRPYSMPYMPRVDMPRSNSSASLKAYGIQTKSGVADSKHFSIAAIPLTSEIDERGPPPSHRNKPVRHYHRQGTSDDTESLWEDSSSFTYVNTPINPSHPEYRQVAKELMSVSPTRKNSNEFNLQIDARRMSETSIDPRRVSNDSGVESSSTTKHNRSLPSTPIAQSFTSVQNGGASTPELRPTTPHGTYLSQESNQSLPHNWDIAHTPQGLPYYLDHETHSTSWKLPDDPDDSLGLPAGWEVVRSSRYGTYFVNHNNKTAIYQHPYHAKPPPPYSSEEEEPKQSRADRKAPARSHSQRNTLTHRVLDPNASLPRRSKSFRDQESPFETTEDVFHERQLSTMTFVPPSPYQIKEIPPWLKEYVESSFGGELDLKIQSGLRIHSLDDLTAWDTMIKRLLKKGSEQIVKQYEYYRVAVQQEIDERLRQQNQYALQKVLKQQQEQQLHQQQSHPPQNPHMHPAFPVPHNHGPSLNSSSSTTQSHHDQFPHYYESEPDITHHVHNHHHLHNHHNHHSHNPHQRRYPVRSSSGRHHSSSNLHSNSNHNGSAPFRTQSYNNLPHTNSSGHLPHLPTSSMTRQGSGFSDLFESLSTMNSVSSLQPRLSDSDFHGLEETFV